MPKIALLEHFEREEHPSRVVPGDAFVDFTEDLGRLEAIEASEQRRRVIVLVEYVISKCILGC